MNPYYNQNDTNKDHYPPRPNKVCPMISDSENAINCLFEKCACYDVKWQKCALLSMVFKK